MLIRTHTATTEGSWGNPCCRQQSGCPCTNPRQESNCQKMLSLPSASSLPALTAARRLRRQIWTLRCPVRPDPHHPHSCREDPGLSRSRANGQKLLSLSMMTVCDPPWPWLLALVPEAIVQNKVKWLLLYLHYSCERICRKSSPLREFHKVLLDFRRMKLFLWIVLLGKYSV